MSLLKIGPGKIDLGNSKTLWQMKGRFRARSNGSFQEAVSSAAYAALKNAIPVFGYEGNSYMSRVWRVVLRLPEALDPINNIGNRIFKISPDLEFTWYPILGRQKTASSAVAETILRQIGGQRAIAMLGAKNLLYDKNSLQFRVARMIIRIVLDPNDTYTVQFYTARGRLKNEFKHIYAGGLKPLIEQETGLFLSL